MKIFQCREIREAEAYAASGGQALHLHRIIVDRDRAPRCFVREVDAGRDIAHLVDLDEARLIATVKQFGVRVVVVEHRGQSFQHVDLCGGPLRKAIAEARAAESGQDDSPVNAIALAITRTVIGAALDRANQTGRAFAVECGPANYGLTARPASRATDAGWTRLFVVQPGDDEMGVLKKIATARQLGFPVPPALLKWATDHRTTTAGPATAPERSETSPEPIARPEPVEPAPAASGPSQGLLF